MATYTGWTYVSGLRQSFDGNTSWNNLTAMKTGGEGDTAPVVGEVSNRLFLEGLSSMFPTLTNSHRLRRIAVRFNLQGKTSDSFHRLKVYWSFAEGYKSSAPAPYPSYNLWSYDETIGYWGFSTGNDGQDAMAQLLDETRSLKLRCDYNTGTTPATLYLKDLQMRVQYDDPPPAPASNGSALLIAA